MAEHRATIIRSTNQYVIRLLVEDLRIKIYVHKVKDGAETSPRGYVMGVNYLEMEYI